MSPSKDRIVTLFPNTDDQTSENPPSQSMCHLALAPSAFKPASNDRRFAELATLSVVRCLFSFISAHLSCFVDAIPAGNPCTGIHTP
jgi:hypothetical protein